VSERTGDEERFASLYDAHRAAVAAYCRRRVSREVVDDVTAEVFVTAWRRVDQIPSGSELPWLYGVARYVVANHQRGSIRRSRLAARIWSHGSHAVRDTPVTDTGWDGSVLEVLARLSPSDQELLRLLASSLLRSGRAAMSAGRRRRRDRLPSTRSLHIARRSGSADRLCSAGAFWPRHDSFARFSMNSANRRSAELADGRIANCTVGRSSSSSGPDHEDFWDAVDTASNRVMHSGSASVTTCGRDAHGSSTTGTWFAPILPYRLTPSPIDAPCRIYCEAISRRTQRWRSRRGR
jgi:DNA-directed RNA polymerase specialized sigma24 family protein